MEKELINTIVHSYFWLYLTLNSLVMFVNWNNDVNKYAKEHDEWRRRNVLKTGKISNINLLSFILLLLWIICCHYY